MAITAQLFDGTILQFPDDTDKSVIDRTVKRVTEEKQIKPDTGFTGAFSAGKERLKGDVALLAGKTGLMSLEDAERYKQEKDALAQLMFKPTEEGFTEAPFLKFRELLGGSLPYMAAPLAAGIGAKALGVGAGVGLAGAGLASLGQFTGSNLSRQIETGKSLEEASLGKAAAAAAPQAALDIVSLRLAPYIGKLFGAAGKEVTPALAKDIAEQGILRTTAAYGAGSAKLAGIEGATEVGQQFLERLQAGLNISDQQARDEYFDSFIGGAVLGGTLAIPGTYLERGATISKGKQMEEDQKQQAILDRKKAEQEAALAERQRIQETQQKLGVSETLALPAPEKKYVEPSEDDPLFNPLGRFQTTDLSAKEITEINQRRQAMGKARIGKTFSIEDLADVFTPEETKTAEGVLGRLVASRTGFQAGDDISPETLNLAAQQRGISTDTQGFRDFLERTTGTNSLENMSPPQRLAVKQALDNIPVGSESQVLQPGITTVKHYTPEQYIKTLSGINKEFAEVGNKPNGRESVLKQIEQYSGLTRRKDQQRLLDQAILSGDLERVVEVRNVNGVEKNVEMIQKPTPRKELPGGMDIRRETFKQGETPDLYEIRSGSRVINQKETAEEAEEELVIHERNRQAKVIDLEKKIASLQAGIQRREAELLNARSLGQDQDNAFFIKSANYYGQDQVANQDIANLRQQQQTFAQPIQIVPVGTRALTQNKFTYYEKGKPTVKFDSEEQAEAYGISRLNDQTLQQIVDSAPSQKQTGRVKRYVDLAQKELDSRTGKKPAGIEITTKQGLEGAEKRLEELGLVKAEAQKKLTDNIETLRKSLLPVLKRFGLEKVGLNIVDSIENGKADGSYVKNLITLALDAKDVMGTLRHESIHALKELGGFTDAEWRVLTNKAKTEWVQKFIKDRGLFKRYQDQYKEDYGSLKGFDEYIQEEAIAEAFRFYSKNKLPAGMIGNIIVRLQKFFEALRNSLNKLGFTTATDIFNKIEEGGIKTAKEAVFEETKLAIKPEGDYKIVRIAQPRGRTTDQVSYELRRISDGRLIREFDKRKDAQQMLDVYTLPQEEVFAKYPELKPKEKPKASLRQTSSLENALNFARDNDFKRNRDLKVAIQNKVLAAADKEGIDLTSTDEETTQHLIKATADDAIYALKSNANAVGWYDITVAKALNVVSLMHPEIQTDPDAKFAFTWALAVTSNGMKVDKNFELAEQAYNTYKKTGKMPINIKAGETQKAINKSLELFNSMVEKYGINDMRKFMATEFTVKQIENLTNLKVGGEFADTRVLGAAILGPKIGNGFFSNLNGIFDQLTMDRWLMRTWGRLTGSLIEDNARLIGNKRVEMDNLIQELVESKNKQTRERFEQVINKTITEKDFANDTAIDTLATAINKASIKPANRSIFNKSNLGETIRKTSNSLVGYIDGQKEAPAGPAERNFIREVFTGALDSVRKRGYPNMTMSDLQALLWYPERRLYDIAKESNISEGYKDDEAPDYTNAASKLVRSNGIPESKIKAVIADTEKEYENRARAVQRDAGKYPSQVGSEGRAAGFAGKERRHFITRGIIRSYRERNEETPNAYKRNGGADGKGFRVLGQKAIAEFKPVIRFKNALLNADVNTPTFYELDSSGAELFQKSIASSKKGSQFGAAVYVYPEEEYANMRTFLTKDGKAGFALKGDDIVSVFSTEPHVGGVNGIMQLAVQEGGRRLDAFDTVLPDLYYNNGFKTVARLGWNDEYKPDNWDKEVFLPFNKGEPDVVFMVYDPTYNKAPTKTDGVKVNEYDQGIEQQVKSIKAGGKFSFRAEEVTPESRYSLALGNIDPTTFLVSEKNPNNTGNLAFMPGAAPFAKYPIRLPVGTHDDISDQGYGANHILRRMQTDVKRRPAEVTKERLEDLILHIENLGKRFKRVYRSGPQLVLYDPLTDDAMFVKQLADHYEVQSMYSDARIPTKYGNAAWSGKNIQPPEAKKFEEKQRGILVQASKEGRVEPKPVGVKVKRVITPNQIEAEAERKPTKGTLSIKKRSLRAPDTPEFKRFFKGSKIVNEDGSPKVMYHGTTEDFNEFIISKKANRTGMPDGFYFTSSADEASNYAQETEGANVMPVYLSIKNPFDLKGKNKITNEMVMQFRDELRKENPDLPFDWIKSKVDIFKENTKAGRFPFPNITFSTDAMKRVFEVGGYDGLLDGDRHVVAFDSNQIKSAFNQKPTTSPDIRYSLKAPDTPEVDAFMNRKEGKSKIVNEDGTPKIYYHGTARDITEFMPKQASAIFFTDNPKFANDFTYMSEEYMNREIFNDLTTEEKEQIQLQALENAKDGLTNADYRRIKSYILELPGTSYGFINNEILFAVNKLLGEKLPSRRNIVPVYIYAQNPFDYQKEDHLETVYAKLDDLGTNSYGVPFGEVYYRDGLSNGNWNAIEDGRVQQVIKDLGFDGFYVKEGGNKNLAVYNSSQIKSAFNVAPTKESKDIRFSFNVAPESHTKLEQVSTYGKTLTDTITNIFTMFKDPEERIKTRIAFVDPNSGLARSLQDQEIYKNGILRADLLARAKAQTINLIRNGLQTGIPVVNSDGSVIIEIDEVNNLANSRIIADRLNDNYYVKGSELSGRAFVAEVARALRGKEIMEEDRIHNAKTGEKRNREKQVTQKQIDWAEQQLKNVPEMQEIFDIWKKVNTGLINLWESVGLFSKAEADTYRAKKFYVSLAASNTDLETMMESQLGFTAAGLKSTPKVQKLEGAEYLRDKSGKVVLDENGDPVPLKRNIWENIDKQYASMMAGAYQNQVRKIAVQQLMDANAASIPTKKRNGVDVGNPNAQGINLRYKDPTNPLADDKGVVHAIVDNATDLAAFESMHYELGPVLKFFGAATNVLRAGALLNPMFWIRQLIRDPIHASIVANGGIVTPFHSAKEYINILRKNSEEAKILASRGVIGQYDSTLDLYTFLNQVGTEKVNQGNLQKAFHKLMQMHEASDAATRVAIFKKEKQSALEKGMTEEEAVNYAVMKAREAINFLVHGNSKTLNAARQMIPFLSASITSLDTVYRAATGYNLPASEKEAAKKLFKQRAALMFGASFAYAILMQDDEEYQKQPNYVKDNNWLIKNPIGDGFLKVAVPYEVGFLFKVVPEVAVRYAYGNDTGKEMIKAYKDGLLHNLPTGGVPVPQAIKPVLENIVNYSFFTGNPVESIGDARLPVEARGRNASETAKFLSGAGLGFVGLSPSKIDNLVQGYFAEAGTFMFTLADELVYALQGKEGTARNLEKQPFFKAFMTDPNADKAVANFYDIQQTANRTVQGFNELKNSGRLEEAREIVEDEEKKMLIASAPTLRKFSENMTKVRRQIEIVKNDQSRTPEERREMVNKLTAQYNIIAQQGVKAANTLGIR